MNEFLKKLLAMMPEDKKTDADETAKSLQDLLDKMESDIRASESKKNEAIGSRDDLKSKIQALARKVGVSYETAADFEKLETAVAGKQGKTKDDDAWAKEKETLQAEIDNLKGQLDETVAKSTQEKLELVLDRDLAQAASKYKVRDKMLRFLSQEVRSQASFEEGKLVFKNEDGTTKRINNEEANIDSVLAEMRSKELEEKEGIFFDISAEQSGPGSNQGGAAGDEDFVPGS